MRGLSRKPAETACAVSPQDDNPHEPASVPMAANPSAGVPTAPLPA